MRRLESFTTFLLVLTLLFNAAWSQSDIRAPIEREGFLHATSYDSLQSFLKSIETIPRIRVESLTTTRSGRTVWVAKVSSSKQFGADANTLRVLLFAQQHGDEPAGKEALTLLLAKLASPQKPTWYDHLELFIVPQMNPDGAELRQRRTSDSIDLNRNHVLLTSAETKALHSLFLQWKPDVTLDAHEYSSSKSWRDSGLIKTADVQLGMLTHPNTPESIRALQHQKIYPFIASEVQRRGYLFQEYIVGSPDSRIRHSTTEINDGRQSFGILNSISFIQEGRKWRGLEDSLRRRAESQLASIEALLEYCALNAQQIRSIVAAERLKLFAAQGQEVVLRMEHVSGQTQRAIPVFNLRTMKDTVWTIAPYHSVVQSLRTTRIPHAYVVPKQLTLVLDLLRRHEIALEEIASEQSLKVEMTVIDSIGVEEIEEAAMPKPSLHRNETTTIVHPGDMMITTKQWQSFLVTILLEPESVWGLTGYSDFEPLLRKTGPYPILRILK